jgi:hypothetical protein
LGVVQIPVCYVVECDFCGEYYGYDYTTHFNNKEEAIHTIKDEEWIIYNDKIICYDCKDKYPTEISKLAVIVNKRKKHAAGPES